MDCPEVESGQRGEKLKTICLTHGTAFVKEIKSKTIS
jgi:hypothetical protein